MPALVLLVVALGALLGNMVWHSEAPKWLAVALGCVPPAWLVVLLIFAPGIKQ